MRDWRLAGRSRLKQVAAVTVRSSRTTHNGAYFSVPQAKRLLSLVVVSIVVAVLLWQTAAWTAEQNFYFKIQMNATRARARAGWLR